jgi:hypothetical protein
MQCEARTYRSVYDLHSNRGGQCSRKAAYVDDHGHYWCTQHAKDYPTVYLKASGKIRANCTAIAKAKGEKE